MQANKVAQLNCETDGNLIREDQDIHEEGLNTPGDLRATPQSQTMYSSATPPMSPAVVSPRSRNIFAKFALSLLGRKKSVSGDRHNKLTKHRDHHYVTSPASTQSSPSALTTPGNSQLPNSASYGSSPAIMKSDQGTSQAKDDRRVSFYHHILYVLSVIADSCTVDGAGSL